MTGALVYIAVNTVSGGCYVGYTTKTLEERRRKHFVQARSCRRRDRFGRAIRKYGEAAFHFLPISEYPCQLAALEAERVFIELLRPRYNISAGGRGCAGYRHSEESKARMRAWHTAHPEHKPRTGVLAPGTGKRGHQTKLARGTVARHWLGIPRSQETKAKVSATKRAKGLKASAKQRENLAIGCAASKEHVSRPIVCPDDGLAYPSAAAAAVAYGLKRHAICAVAAKNGRNKTIGGLRFEYVEGAP